MKVLLSALGWLRQGDMAGDGAEVGGRGRDAGEMF